MNLILPTISIGFTIIILIVYLIMSGKDKKPTQNTKSTSKTTAQYFINIQDIHDNILYELDGNKKIFIELESICIDLLNNNDVIRIIKELSSEISKLNIEFDLFAISRPFNIEILKQQYEDDILNAKTDIQRKLLRNALSQILSFGENGEVVERKFYLIVQGLENENDILKKAELLIECFKKTNLKCYILKDPEIKRLINLFNNLATYNYDKMLDTTNNTIPFINQDLEKEKTIDEKLKEQEEQQQNQGIEEKQE